MTATLKMVAEEAGVSIRTAGRALKGTGPVKSSVAEKVREAARRFSYVPNAAARRLRSRSCRIAGILTGKISRCEMGHTRLQMLTEKLRAKGLDVLLGTLPDTFAELEKLLRNWTGVVEYVVLSGWDSSWDPEPLRNLPIRFVFLDCDPGRDGFDCLLTDRSRGVEEAVRGLISAGCRSIVHVSGSTLSSGRISGFDRAMASAPPEVHSIRITAAGLEFSDGYQAGDALISAGADGVFFDTDRMALGFYRYAHEHNLRIPEEIAVAGFDNDSAGQFAIPSLTTVEHPLEEATDLAVRIIAEHNFSAPPVRQVIASRFLRRESAAEKNKKQP